MKKTFEDPLAIERDYTRELLNLSRGLQVFANQKILPRIKFIKEEYERESRTDSWIDYIDGLLAELYSRAVTLAYIAIQTLPGRFIAISKFNEGQFKLVVKANTGFDLPPVMQGAPKSSILGVNVFRSEPFLKPLAEGWIRENTDLIKSIPRKLNADIEGIIRRGVMNGTSVKTLAQEIKAKYKVSDYRAKLIAQDQTLKLHADLTQKRLQSVGVKQYIWRTVGDSRVRPDHMERAGNKYSWDKPPSGGEHPGHGFRCRCRAEGIFPEDN